jgi:hypothetical protein
MEPPSMDKLVQFFDPRQAQEDALQQIKIVTFISLYRFLAKLCYTISSPWDAVVGLFLKELDWCMLLFKMYGSVCKFLLHVMIDMFDDHTCGLPFGCLVTRICQRYVPYIPPIEQFLMIQDSLGSQTIMKYDAQLSRYEDPVDVKSPPHAPPPQPHPSAASSSQSTPPPSSFEEMYSLLSAQMITGFQHLQGCISSVDARVHALDAKMERCLQHLESDDDADEDLD